MYLKDSYTGTTENSCSVAGKEKLLRIRPPSGTKKSKALPGGIKVSRTSPVRLTLAHTAERPLSRARSPTLRGCSSVLKYDL